MHSNSTLYMVAGTETTATLLRFVHVNSPESLLTSTSGLTYYLLRNPSTMSLLVEELRTTFHTESSITIEALASLPYLNACIEEGLRIYPPAPVGLPRRIPEGGIAVGDDWVPEGTTVAITQLATYRSKDNWYEPYQFLPERWLSKDECFARDDHSCFQPFSTGPRNCIGKSSRCILWYAFQALTVLQAKISHTMRCACCCARSCGTLTSSLPRKVRIGLIRGSTSCGRRGHCS